jgi:REP element-mobilizing transposase RayT
MSRPLRVAFPGAVYHVMSRGNAKALVFLDQRDFEKFVAVLKAACARFGVVCYAFCLMPNHYHLVVMTPQPNLSAAIKHLNGVYAQWWNYRHQRCGHVFQGRFKAQLVQEDRYLLAVCRYVVLNPVRAGLVAHPREWKWSSYRASAQLEPAPRFLHTSAFDGLLARHSSAPAGVAYRQFVSDEPGDGEEMTRLIRGDERFLGDASFLADERASRAVLASPEVPRREVRRPAASLVDVLGQARSRQERNRRVWRAAVDFGYTAGDIAKHLGLHPYTVNAILRSFRGGARSSRPKRTEAGVGWPRELT